MPTSGSPLCICRGSTATRSSTSSTPGGLRCSQPAPGYVGSARRGGCRTNPRRAPWIRSNRGLRKLRVVRRTPPTARGVAPPRRPGTALTDQGETSRGAVVAEGQKTTRVSNDQFKEIFLGGYGGLRKLLPGGRTSTASLPATPRRSGVYPIVNQFHKYQRRWRILNETTQRFPDAIWARRDPVADRLCCAHGNGLAFVWFALSASALFNVLPDGCVIWDEGACVELPLRQSRAIVAWALLAFVGIGALGLASLRAFATPSGGARARGPRTEPCAAGATRLARRTRFRWRLTTAPARSCSRPPRICRSTRRTRSCKRPCARSTRAGTGSS